MTFSKLLYIAVNKVEAASDFLRWYIADFKVFEKKLDDEPKVHSEE